MNTKEKLLGLFESYKGIYISGEEIANQLCISRSAVWKAVNQLRKDGYEIDAIKNKGYRLSLDTDILSSQGIQKYLKPVCESLDIHVVEKVSSTNSVVREKANAGVLEGYTLIANSQTKGRGRFERMFYSPKDTGIYMSILLRPTHMTPSQAVHITTMAAVAACEAIEEIANKKADIKWVNDIYLNGKKVSGILTEASFNMETSSLDYIVLGIGLNVYPSIEGFPKEIEDIAGTIFDERQKDAKNALTARFLNNFMNYYIQNNKDLFIESYRKRSLAIGKNIMILSSSGNRNAEALDVDEDCRLVVQYEDGRIDHLSSGEISIRL